jgi:hyperosmotically inducible protein
MRIITINVTLLVTLGVITVLAADKPAETMQAYVDSDLCSRIMVGPIDAPRTECSRSTHKDGSPPVLLRLNDSTVFEVDKGKQLKENVGNFVEATGEVKEKDAKFKLQSVRSVDAKTVASGPGKSMLDVRQYRTKGDRMYEQIRHELAMMPYISEFDFISFAATGGHVILSGWTVRVTNRSTAYNLVKNIEGVETITNNINVLPLGRNDMTIRAGARAALARHLSRYFWGSGSDIKIIVKNGDIILLGNVTRQSDKDIAFIQCNSVPGAFKVFNMLRVTGEQQQKSD